MASMFSESRLHRDSLNFLNARRALEPLSLFVSTKAQYPIRLITASTFSKEMAEMFQKHYLKRYSVKESKIFSIREQGFKSPWGYTCEKRASLSRIKACVQKDTLPYRYISAHIDPYSDT